MKLLIFFLTFGIFTFIEAEQKCVKGTTNVCTPFFYEGVNYTDCYNSLVFGDWCLVDGQTGSGSDYSNCAECKEPEKPTTTSTVAPKNNEQKAYVKKCVKDTNEVCTPFTYYGKEYNDCEFHDAWGIIKNDYHWCIVGNQTGDGNDYSNCGDCVEDTITKKEQTPESHSTTKTEKTNKSIKNVAEVSRVKKCVKDTGNVCVPFKYKGMVYDDCKTQYVGKPWCLIGNQTGDYLDYSSCAPCDEEKYVLHDMTNYQYKTINHDPAIGQGTSVIIILAGVAIAVVLIVVLSILGVIQYRRHKNRNLLIKYNQADAEENDKL